jgi:hypothetical protein
MSCDSRTRGRDPETRTYRRAVDEDAQPDPENDDPQVREGSKLRSPNEAEGDADVEDHAIKARLSANEEPSPEQQTQQIKTEDQALAQRGDDPDDKQAVKIRSG